MSVLTTPTPAQFRMEHGALTDALATAGMAIPTRPAAPVLGGVLLETRNDAVTVHGFDYDVAVSTTIPLQAAAPAGKSLLDYSELKKILTGTAAGDTKARTRSMPVHLDGDLLTTPDLAIPVRAHNLEDYPALPEPAAPLTAVDGHLFLRQLARVLPATGDDVTLPALTCIQVTVTSTSVQTAATDRWRMAVAKVPATGRLCPTPTTALVPSGILAQLAKRLRIYDGPVRIGIVPPGGEEPARVTFRLGRTQITARVHDDRLPRHEHLMPRQAATTLTLDRLQAVRAARKTRALARAKGGTNAPLRLSWDGSGAVRLAPALGEGERVRVRGVRVDAAVCGHAADGGMGVNPDFLLDALDAFTGATVTLHLPPVAAGGEVVKPVLFTDAASIRGAGYRHLLMPVRLAG